MKRKSRSKRRRDKFHLVTSRMQSVLFENPVPSHPTYLKEVCEIFRDFDNEDFRIWWQTNQIELLDRVTVNPDGTQTLIQFSPGLIIPVDLSTDRENSEFDQ